MAKGKKKSKWPADTGPDRDELVHALRAFISLASCWLDRDPHIRGKDSTQARKLRTILKLLIEAEADQQEEVAVVMAAGVKDVLAVALGAATVRDDLGRVCLEERMFPGCKLPAVVPMQLAQGPSSKQDSVAAVFENATVQHALYAARSSVDAQAFARVVAEASAARANAERGGRDGPDQAASVAVLNLRLVDGAYSKHTESATRLFGRWLEFERHPDRAGPDGVDAGLYFGAPTTEIPSPGGAESFDARAESAATLVAQVFGLDPKVARRLHEADTGWPGLWQLAARGRAETGAQQKSLDRVRRILEGALSGNDENCADSKP